MKLIHGAEHQAPGRRRLAALFFGLACTLSALYPAAVAQSSAVEAGEPADTSDAWLDLGVDQDLAGLDRGLTKDQIRGFIPPLLRGFTPLHAYVLPPKTFVVDFSNRRAALNGEDFFVFGDENLEVFGDSRVERTFIDLGIFYGFDFGRKHLHSFTAFLNIPYLASRTDGAIHPNGVALFDVMNRGATQELGDISLIIKKKVKDQANFPMGAAVMAGVFFPTGANDEKFGEDGIVATRMPAMAGPPAVDMPMPIAMMMTMPSMVGAFPFNDGVFNRFSDDGRLPSVLQPGDGAYSFVLGGALTRQFLPGDLPPLDRAAFHAGTMHRFRRSSDGIDRGDLNTHQVSFVAPVLTDFLALEVGYLGFYQFADHYNGTFITPFLTDSMGRNMTHDATHVTFKEVERPSFTKGEWGNFVTSLIFSPDPQLRLVGTVLTRVVEPRLGPAPPLVVRIGMEALF